MIINPSILTTMMYSVAAREMQNQNNNQRNIKRRSENCAIYENDRERIEKEIENLRENKPTNLYMCLC